MKRVSEERSVLQRCADEEVDSDASTVTLSTHRQTHENDPVDSEATILYDYKVYMESDCSSTETLDSSCSQGTIMFFSLKYQKDNSNNNNNSVTIISSLFTCTSTVVLFYVKCIA